MMPLPPVDVNPLPRLPNPADIVNERLAKTAESVSTSAKIEEKAEALHVETMNGNVSLSNVSAA